MKKVPGKEGYRYIKLSKNSIKSIFGNLKLEATRAKVYKALNTKLVDKNIPILEQLVQKRHQLARLYNYSSYSDFTLRSNMAQNASTVQEFEEKLTKKALKKAH